MSAALDRALLLYQQSRYELAAQELRRFLQETPQHPFAHALLALCLLESGRSSEAEQEARQAILQGPDQCFSHYAMASILFRDDRLDEAEAAIREALRLDPTSADCLSTLGNIRLCRKEWAGVLETAEVGLREDPEHEICTHLRASALIHLDRLSEAESGVSAALALRPDSALFHADRGWLLLHRNDAAGAMSGFREALRLDPGLEWAQDGIVEAMKSRNPLYRIILRQTLQDAREGRQSGWKASPPVLAAFAVVCGATWLWDLAFVWVGLFILGFILFKLVSWFGNPLFVLLLRLDRIGRLALSRDDILTSNWVAGCLAVSVVSLLASILMERESLASIAIPSLLFILPIELTFACPEGKRRRIMTCYTALLGALGVVGPIMIMRGFPWGDNVLVAYIFGALFSGLVLRYANRQMRVDSLPPDGDAPPP